MKMSNKVYDILKWVVIVGLPAILAFLNVVLPVSGVSAEVVNIISTWISATTVLIGTFIGVSSVQYKKSSKE